MLTIFTKTLTISIYLTLLDNNIQLKTIFNTKIVERNDTSKYSLLLSKQTRKMKSKLQQLIEQEAVFFVFSIAFYLFTRSVTTFDCFYITLQEATELQKTRSL